MMYHAKFGRKLTACEARDLLDRRFFPSTGSVDFPNLSDLLGSDWGGSTDSPVSYRNDALALCERIYGKAF